ncbi:MAG: hypothetical protein KDA65_09550 [Planctomycetaceae bacterium]|nr:hypothetical protein [Planctomycetaceae bacterium]
MKKIHVLLLIVLATGFIGFSGCEKQPPEETNTIDIQAPGIDIKVKKTTEGKTEVEVEAGDQE